LPSCRVEKLLLEMLSVPETVILPAMDLEPIARVPAVMAAMSAVATVNGPAPPAMVTAFVPFGINDTVPVPALTVTVEVTSLAVIVMAELVLEMEVLPALVTFPVPSVVMVTPVVPVALAFSAIVPFDPDEVLNTKELPENALDAVMLPLAVIVNVPVLDVIAPLVVKLAEAPVVVSEKAPPTVEAPTDTAPALLT